MSLVNLGFLLALSELERTRSATATPEGAPAPASGGAAASAAAAAGEDTRARKQLDAGSDRRSQALEMVAHTLRCMSRGGIHDHIGLVRSTRKTYSLHCY